MCQCCDTAHVAVDKYSRALKIRLEKLLSEGAHQLTSRFPCRNLRQALELWSPIRYHRQQLISGKPVFLSAWSPAWQPIRKLGLAVTIAVAAMSSGVAFGKGPAPSTDSVAVAALPQEAQTTERLIRAGGPFPYAKDGSVFGNRERALPGQPRGFYREYTVTTKGSRNRGARRIVCGGPVPTKPETCFYTADHYQSFRRIVQ